MIPLGPLFCSLGAASVYLYWRSCESDAEYLKSVTRVKQLKDLAQLLDTAHKGVPLVVAISGRVGSETPISWDRSSWRVVIVEETTEKTCWKQNDAGLCKQDSTYWRSSRKEVPWYLDDGTARVYVVGARYATGLGLTAASDVFEESRGNPKMRGVRTEWVLPIGTSLTAVGKVVKNNVGKIRVHSFYVSQQSIDRRISNIEESTRWCRYAFMGFTFVGASLIAGHAINYILERR